MFFLGGGGRNPFFFLSVVINVLWRLVGSRHLYDDSSHFRQNVDFISPHRPCAAITFVYRVVYYVHNVHTSVWLGRKRT